ncbi:MAG: hypothetical protein LBK73_12195 [Treponema sp.]|jgi:hypothetical protein|nr:hypothetical protein [Treponema sp.]
MKATITFVDGNEITVACAGFNTWHNDEITLTLNNDTLPKVCYKFPDALVRKCEIRHDDGLLAYLNEAVNDKYVNGKIDKDGRLVKYTQSIWDIERMGWYLENGAKRLNRKINRKINRKNKCYAYTNTEKLKRGQLNER